MANLCVFGDSITWGSADKEMGGWVNRLRIALNKEKDISVYNCGVSGDTTTDLLARFEVEAKARITRYDEDMKYYILFSVGINDSQYLKPQNEFRTPIIEFKKKLAELFKQAKELTNKIAFIGLTDIDETKTTPIPWNKSKFYYSTNASDYNNAIKQFCKENNLLFIDLTGVLKPNDLFDGLHPNEKGHEKIYQKVKEELYNNKFT